MTCQPPPTRNYLSRVRGIALLPDETVSRVFSLEEGLLDEPPSRGQLLFATSQRILFFRGDGTSREATVLPLEDLRGVTLDTSARGTLSLFKGALTLLAALVFYAVVAYWLAGRIDSPPVPGINMDFVPFVVLAAVLVGAWLYWRHSVKRAGGKVTLQGSNWQLTFSVDGAEHIPEINLVVESLFLDRRQLIRSIRDPRVTS